MSTFAKNAALAVLRRIAEGFTSGPLPEWETFTRAATLIDSRPREIITPKDDQRVYVVVTGLVKLVGTNEDGSQFVKEFFTTGNAVVPNARPNWAMSKSNPFSSARWMSSDWALTPKSLVAIRRTTLVTFDYRLIERLVARHSEWGEIQSVFLWAGYEALLAHSDRFRLKDLSTQYSMFVNERPDVARHASQRDLASYFNVTESTLSRVASNHHRS